MAGGGFVEVLAWFAVVSWSGRKEARAGVIGVDIVEDAAMGIGWWANEKSGQGAWRWRCWTPKREGGGEAMFGFVDWGLVAAVIEMCRRFGSEKYVLCKNLTSV